MKKSGALWLIAVGGVFLAYQLGWISFGIGDLIRTFWPMILILIGLQKLLDTKKMSSSIVGSVIMIVIGGYFQTRNLGMHVLSPGEFFKIMIPAALIATGVYVLLKPKRSPEYPSVQRDNPEDFHHSAPPAPPVPPMPIEPLESPLDRMFVNLDKEEPAGDGEPRSRYDWAPERDGRSDGESEQPAAGRERSNEGSEFHKIGGIAREFGKQTAEQMRKIDFSRIADEVKHEVDSAMHDFKKSLGKEGDKQAGPRHKSGVPLDKEPFPDYFAEDSRFYDDCREDIREEENDRAEMKKARQQADKEKKEKTVNESSFIGDYYIGKDYFRLKPLNISHFVGDTVIDLTKAQIPYGTTRINISCFIGDVVIYVPNDPELGVRANSSSFLGDHNVLGSTRSGIVSGVDETQNYDECAKRIKISASSFIGDVHVTRVG